MVTPPEPPREKVWYGWQVMLTDVAAVGVLLADTETAKLVPAGLALYVAGGPTVHLVHGKPGRAGLSLGLRLALPLVGAMVGAGLDRSQYDECCEDGVILGAGAGILAAGILDWTALSTEWKDPPKEPVIAPSFWADRDRGGAGFGVAGQF